MKRTCNKCSEQKIQTSSGRWRCRTCENKYQREYYAINADVIRPKKSEYMRQARQDPKKHARILISQRKAYANGGAEKQSNRLKKMQDNEPFRWRAYLARNKWNPTITEGDLIELWEKQKGYGLNLHIIK